MENNLSLVQKLDPSWTVDNLSVVVNGIDIPMNLLLTYEVLWNGLEAKGVVSFSDYKELSKTMNLNIGGFVEVSFTSQQGSKSSSEAPFSKIFSITKNVKGEVNPEPMVEIHFEDMNTAKMKKSFISKTYIDKKPSDSFAEYFSDLGLEGVIVAGNENETEVSIHTPAHKSCYEYFQAECKYRGYEYIQDRNSSYIVHDSHRTNEKAKHTGEVFEYKPRNIASRAQVIEYDLEGFDISAIERSIPTLANEINPENTSKAELSTKVTEVIGTGGTVSSVAVSDLYAYQGKKITGGKYSTVDTDSLTKDLKELQKMSIWIPGWNGNRLGMKITVELPRPVQTSQTLPDEVYSGEWVVNKCRDKIINSFFIQELFLSRAGS